MIEIVVALFPRRAFLRPSSLGVVCWFLASASASSLLAQSPAPTAPAKAPSEIIELSAFVVNSERDTGYQATNTLAGTRLATPIKDVGAAISIYTKDFLADIGATNINDLLVFATNMEAAGSQGNYSGSGAGISDWQVVGDGPRSNPQGSTRTRGLAGPTLTRGYFITNIATDGYNATAVTVNRGPNAILFGIGSPAGVVDTGLIQANLSRPNTKVEHRYGDNSSNRFIFETNQVIVLGKLAIRLAALHDRERYDQHPAYQDKKRIFGTVTLSPYRSTSIRANFESGNTHANRPISVLPYDSISKFWYAAGRPSYDWTSYDDPARNPAAATTNANTMLPVGVQQGQIFTTIVIPYAPGAQVPGTAFRSQITSTNITGSSSLAANSIRNQLLHPTANRDFAVDGIQFYETINIGEVNLPASAFPGGIKPAGIKQQGFINYDAFPFNKAMIDETSYQGDSFRTYSTTIEQSFWRDPNGVNRVGLELAYNREAFSRYSSNQFFSEANGNHIRVDPNVSLTDGTPNPNVGRPYVTGAVGSQTNWYDSDRETKRATAYLRYNLKDAFPVLGRWLGRHTMTGLYEEYAAEQLSYSTRVAMFGPVADLVSANPAGFSRRPAVVAYLGDSILNGAPLKLQPVRIPRIEAGLVVPTTYFSAPANSPTQGNFTTALTTFNDVFGGGQASREVIKSRAAVLQSYWLDEQVITTFGWRRDQDYLFRRNLTYVENPSRVRYSLHEFDFPSTPPPVDAGEIKTYSAVLRWPRKLIPLPPGTDLGVFYNESSNFTPSGARITALLERIPSPQGKTREFGVNFSLFGDKLNLRVNRFETSVQNQGFTSQVYSDAYNNGVRQLASFWAQERNINPGIDRTADIELLFSPVPEFRKGLGFKYTGGTGSVPYDSIYENPPGIADTTDYVAKGTEVELTYNPVRSWRLMLNIAKQETVQSNIAPATRDFIEKMKPVWTQLADRPRANYPAGYVPGTPLPIGTATVGSWMQTNVLVPYATLLASEGQVSAEQRKWRANLITNFTFDRGLLKGFGVGAGLRWQDKFILGYPSSLKPDGSVFIDIKHPYWSKTDTNVDAWISYARKIARDRIKWKIQLNVRNLIGDDIPVGMRVQPDGSPAITRIPPEKRLYLTNTFEF